MAVDDYHEALIREEHGVGYDEYYSEGSQLGGCIVALFLITFGFSGLVAVTWLMGKLGWVADAPC